MSNATNNAINTGMPIEIEFGGTGSGSSTASTIVTVNSANTAYEPLTPGANEIVIYDFNSAADALGISSGETIYHNANSNTLVSGYLPITAGGTNTAAATLNTFVTVNAAGDTYTFLTGAANEIVTFDSNGLPSVVAVAADQTIYNDGADLVAGLLPSAAGGTGVSSLTAHGIVIAEGSNPMNSIVLDANQVLIGTSLTTDPVPGYIGSVTTWFDVTVTDPITLAGSAGYVADADGTVSLNLPASIAFGQVISVVGGVASTTDLSWAITAGDGQTIHFGTATVLAGGILSSTKKYDSISLLCVNANTDFVVLDSVGNIAIANP